MAGELTAQGLATGQAITLAQPVCSLHMGLMNSPLMGSAFMIIWP